MDITADLDADLPADVLRATVADLGTYPRWLDIVARAVPLDDGGALPAWSVDLRGQIGPLRRSKRLRMERTVDEADHLRFERRELDGREHSPWVMEGRLRPRPGGTVLTMRLHYGGSLWVPLLDRLLRDEIERSRPRLVDEASLNV